MFDISKVNKTVTKIDDSFYRLLYTYRIGDKEAGVCVRCPIDRYDNEQEREDELNIYALKKGVEKESVF